MSQPDAVRIVFYAPSARSQPLAPLLEQAGAVVRVCHEDLEALALVLRDEADVVCVETLGQIPERFLRILRRRSEQQALSIVSVQNTFDPVQQAAALRAGADAVICDQDSLEVVEATLFAQGRLREAIGSAMRRRGVLESVLDLVDEAALVMNREGRVLHANRSCLRLLDLDPDVLRERSVPQLLNVLGVARETIDRVMHSEEALLDNIEIHTPEGLRQVIVDCRRLADLPADRQQRWLVQFRDASLLHTLDKMEADFQAWAAHELRSHLALLTAEVEAFQDSEHQLGATQISESMRRDVENLAASIEARLAEANGESEAETSDLEDVSLVGWLENSLVEVESLALARRQTLRLHLDPDLRGLRFRARCQPLQQVLRYVLVDAIRSCADAVEIRIEAEMVQDDLHLALRCAVAGAADTGSEMSSELLSAQGILREEGGDLRRGIGAGLETRIRVPVFVPREATLSS